MIATELLSRLTARQDRSYMEIFLFQSERHLDKITMVDEFLKRIFTVLHSNDPVARALTLRTLGAISGIIPERKQGRRRRRRTNKFFHSLH